MNKRIKSRSIDVVEPVARNNSRQLAATLRQRAAWMYYVEEMTQSAIAETLGIGRVTVVRLIAEARALNEVKISLRRDFAELSQLETALQRRFDIERVVVAPRSSKTANATVAISAAVGQLMSEILKPNMMLGVGWGKTLLHSIPFIEEIEVPGMTIVSLLGGISAVHRYNPAEFAWRFSELLKADCYLIAAPALVDSKETKKALVERCGIGPVFELAPKLDAVLLSVGSTSPESTAWLFDVMTQEDRKSLIAAGAVGDVLFNFFNREGKLVKHTINDRAMSVAVSQIQKVPLRVLASGGEEKVPALIGALRLLKPQILVTDEFAAKAILAQT